MNAVPFLLCLLVLAGGTYAMRLLGVHLGSKVTERADAAAAEDSEEAPAARAWMDRATVVLICAVAATTMVFEGEDFAGPARVIGSLTGCVAALLRLPLLGCVVLAMAVCAGLRLLGVA